MNPLLFLATVAPFQTMPDLTPQKAETEVLSGNLAVLMFAALVVIIFVSAWAIFIRKPARTVGLTPEEAAAALSKSGRKRKVKHRFPTIGETGGLPPNKS